MKQNFITKNTTTRRQFVKTTGVVAAVSSLGFPGLVLGAKKEIVIGGAGSHTSWVRDIITPYFEKKYDCKILFEGTKSSVNLEKMRSNKNNPYLSVVMMDDPVLILAVQEDVIEKLTPRDIPNISKIASRAVHLGGMWANYQQPWSGIAYNTKKVPDGVSSWADLWNPKYKGKVIIPSLQNTEGMWAFFLAGHIATGKPLNESQFDVDANFEKMEKLKPNLLTIYTKLPQAFNLLEQGEAWLLAGGISSHILPRKADGAPVDLAAPKEAICAMPYGIAKVKNGPEPDLANSYINEMLGAELQGMLVPSTFSIPTNPGVSMPSGIPQGTEVFSPDWTFVSKNRRTWIERWDKQMSA